MRHLIKMSMVLLASVSVYFVYGFTKEVAPIFVAVIAAGSLVSVYVGLAFADIPKDQQRSAVTIAGLAMAIEAVYGILYAMAVQAPHLFEDPPLWATITLSILHGSPFTFLLFVVSTFVVHSEQQASTVSNEQRISFLVQQSSDVAQQTTALLEAMQDRMLTMHEHSYEATDAMLEAPKAKSYSCPECGSTLNKGAYMTAHKHGYCASCRDEVLAQRNGVDA
jgi:hypothetical protein